MKPEMATWGNPHIAPMTTFGKSERHTPSLPLYVTTPR
jgi:hypothetical protein